MEEVKFLNEIPKNNKIGKEFFIIIVISLIMGAISGAGVSYYLLNKEKSQDLLIKDFYETENAVYVSPHSLRV
ncbi:MAG: hypothetical protein Q7S33_00200, partial [Nanoarchaeota archaeon]|nr:hypothetical protein [Nanoarchaeota archaeon]